MANAPIPPSGLYRYPRSANASDSAFGLTAGLVAANAASNTQREVFGLSGAEGVHLRFGGLGADNTTFDYRIWVVHYTYDATGLASGYEQQCFGGGSVTLGAVATEGGTAAATTVTGRMADTLSFARTKADGTATSPADVKGPGEIIETAMSSGGGSALSPTGDKLAALYIPKLGWADGIIVEYDMTGATSAFCLIGRM